MVTPHMPNVKQKMIVKLKKKWKYQRLTTLLKQYNKLKVLALDNSAKTTLSIMFTLFLYIVPYKGY